MTGLTVGVGSVGMLGIVGSVSLGMIVQLVCCRSTDSGCFCSCGVEQPSVTVSKATRKLSVRYSLSIDLGWLPRDGVVEAVVATSHPDAVGVVDVVEVAGSNVRLSPSHTVR